MKFRILVVDDEKNIREGLGEFLKLEGYEIVLAEDGESGSRIAETDDIDLVITDLKMPGMSGHDLLKKLAGYRPSVPVIVFTGHGTVEDAVNAIRAGAYDFMTKPVNLDHLALLVKRALESRELARQNMELLHEVERQRHRSSIIGKSQAMGRVFDLIRKVASSKASVLITGESGVGKELVADALHNLSSRVDGPFIKVHCAALAESLLESELFGHEKGAFTGASIRKRGRFELANEGTLFLDEIGEINQNVQVKILRVLQEKSFERVGGETTIEVDVRLIAATNRDLKEEIANGRFREDLYYRLNVVNIHVPPLRERKDDIPLLAMAFLKEFAQDNKRDINAFESKAMSALYTYSWPGNVRELRNSIESALVLASGNSIQLEDLPESIRKIGEQKIIRIENGTSLQDAEKIIIQETLAAQGGNKSRTAEILGIGRKTLYQKINDYKLAKPD